MKKLYMLGIVALATVIIGLAWAEQMTFSTYYPAPYGVYREMQVQRLRFQEDIDGIASFNYPDATYDRRLRITAGKDDAVANAQGACIDLHGNNRPQDTALGGELHLVAGSAGGPVLFYTGNPASEAMRVTSAGNVGIGTTSPGATLEVKGTVKMFGEWVDVSAAASGGAVQGPAATDGFVLAWGTADMDIDGYTDATTHRISSHSCSAGRSDITMPVRKDDTWKVTGASKVYWIPFGN